MKKWILAAGLVLAVTSAHAQYGTRNPYSFGTGSNSQSHETQGYTTQRGTYVEPHQATNPNSTQYDNYGSRGNVNPYTGQVGTRTPRY